MSIIKLSNWERKRRGVSIIKVAFAIGGFCCLCMGSYSLNFLHSQFASDASYYASPMYSLVKMAHGPPGTWNVVDWWNPFTAEEEAKFSCEMADFIAAKSGKQSQMCVHSFREVITDFIHKDKRWRDCNSLPELWVADGMKDDDSIYIDIGANIGSCVMEMLMSTNARIIAFEPHPMNVYNIKKTVSKLGKEYQDRLLLFPVGLGSIPSNTTIYAGHDNMGNSQLGTMVQDWGHQTFKEHLQFQVFIERMDSLLDTSAINNIRFIKMDAQGFECNVVDGMRLFESKIQYMKFEYSNKFLSAHDCSDLVPRVNKLGLKVYYHGQSNGEQYLSGQEIDKNTKIPHYKDLELMGRRPSA